MNRKHWMKKLVLAMAAAAIPAAVCTSAMAQLPIPTDAKAACPLTKEDLSGWYLSGAIAPNGFVKPADSLNFAIDPKNPHCSFYRWSAQMFLWLTSPTSGTGGRVFDSSVFLDVGQQNGKRVMIPHTPGTVKNFAVRSSQVGPRGKLIAVADDGSITEIETGQAGGNGTLMAQNGSLVYYSVQVNNVYADFFTGSSQGAFNPPIDQFPTTPTDLKQIIAFASSNGRNLPAANALTMEIKSSWVEASSVDADDYVTMTATIPTYDFTQAPNPNWPQVGTKTTTLAMVGMHVVGSVNGHPEMVWATVEHLNNAPNDTYSYTAQDGSTKTVPFSTANPSGKDWLFCAKDAVAPFNVETLVTDSGKIALPTPDPNRPPVVGKPPVPSNTIRSFAWGASSDTGVDDLTEVISLNNSLQQLLPDGDVRKNYALIGAVWTGGGIPGVDNQGADSLGSTQLANATMETYFQKSTMNCFSCHQGGQLKGLSHIWGSLTPLSK